MTRWTAITTMVNIFSSIEKKKQSFFPNIKKGTLQILAAALSAKVGIELEKTPERSYQSISFSEFLQKVERAFSRLNADQKGTLYIFLDELELGYMSKKQYQRDSCIIRDLIVSVSYINDFCKKYKFPIKIITSVRLEVLMSISAIGKEINKVVEDFGTLISWHQAGGDDREHPLIRIIMKRLLFAEELLEIKENIENIRKKYFPNERIQNKTVERYILDNSWYRPRDIVRFLNLAKDHAPNESSFTHSIFDGIRKTYSIKSWTECLEEMKARYNNEQLEALKIIFNGWKREFTSEEFSDRVLACKRQDTRLEVFKEKKVGELLENLYRVGIIGNKYMDFNTMKYRFVFRGDEGLFLDKKMMIHSALVPVFSL